MSKTFIKRPLCFILSLLMIVGLYPFSILSVGSAVPTPFSAMGETKTADPSTMNDWVKYFNDTTTEYAGGVWTDKSVFTDASAFTANGISMKKTDDFLVALSAMASNKTVTGQASAPTDTMIVLDLSSSMYSAASGYASTVETMLNTVNDMIVKLQGLNEHNRVGVTIYFGHTTLGDAPANSYQLWLPLDRYTHSSNTFLKVTKDGQNLKSAGVNTNVKNAAGTTVSNVTRTVPSVAGTYVQQGILSALKQFLAADTKVPSNASVQPGTDRIPVMVLMSDGKPTAATNYYNQLDKTGVIGSNREDMRSPAETDFLTQLTAAYAKEMMDAHYEASPLFYSLSLGNGISYDVMDPSNSLKLNNGDYSSKINNYWNNLISAAKSIDITGEVWDGGWTTPFKTKSIKLNVAKTTVSGKTMSGSKSFPSSISQQHYVDEAFIAETRNDLANTFADIFTSISLQSKIYPTLVEGDANLSGYVSFVDKLGKYMEVKDVKGLLINNVLHTGRSFAKHLIEHHSNGNIATDPNDVCYAFIDSVEKRLNISEATALTLVAQAIDKGQLAYNATANTFSNYIGWFSDADGNFVGFWYDGIANIPAAATHINRSYGFFGDTDASHHIDEHDMLYATVRVREEIATEFESVAFAVPASLIPTKTYNVSLDEHGNPTNMTVTGDRSPIRLVYEAGLEDEINEVTVKTLVNDAEYLAEHFKNGEYEFFTNRFDHGTDVTAYGTNNTYSYFTPSKENERYYYLTDSPIYSDTNGTLYTGGTPSSTGTYYRAVTVYQKNGANLSKNTVYEQIMPYALSSSSHLVQKGANWYVKAGTAHNYVENTEVLKTNNLTGSINYSYHPFVDSQYSYVVGAVLGNNGRLVVTPAMGIQIGKTVEEVNTDAGAPTSFNFTVTNKTNATDGATYKSYHVTAGGVVTEGIISFTNGKASFSIKDGEKFYITGMKEGNVFTVTEAETAYYICKQNDIDLTVVGKSIARANFVNTARGKGNLTVAKEVAHDFGTDYQIPADKIFNFEVTLEGVGIIGSTFAAKHSGDATVTAVTIGADGKVTFSLKHNEEFEIYGLPEGTKATVVELNPGAGFTPNYYENNVLGDGALIVQRDIIDVVTVINDYNPTKVDPVNITVNVSKILEGRDWKADDEFTFVLQKLNIDGTTWTDLSTASVKGTDASKTAAFTDVFANATYDKAGTYYYRITEKEGSVIGMNYDRTVHAFAVTVGDADMDGKLEITEVKPERDTVTVAFSGGSWNVTANFKNVYDLKGTTASIDITKLITNESGSSLALLSGYKFELYEGTTLVATSEPTTDRGFTRLNITFKEVGEHTYTLKEIVPATIPAGWTYDPKEVTIKVSVTADTTEGVLVAKFADTGTNTTAATFTNTYAPTSATLNLDVRKNLTGRDLKDGEFSFTIVDADGSFGGYTETVKNTVSGDVPFSTLTFTKVGTYKFDISETKGDLGGVTYDQNKYRVLVTVTDNNGVLTASYVVESTAENYIIFNNTYTAKSVKHAIGGNKVLTGRDLLNAEFKFTLAESDANGNIVAGGKSFTAENRLNGSFSFPEIEYTKVGDYYYVVSEVNNSAIPGVKYDTTKYIVKITVKDDLNGQLTVETPVIHIAGGGAADEIKFTNEYIPAPTSADITGDKVYETMINGAVVGKEFGANAFSFSIYESNAEWAENGKLIETVSNDASGHFSFKTLNFTKAGEYYYIVKELHGGKTINGVVYDNAVFRIRIEVKDDGNGKLYTVVHKTDKNGLSVESIEFKNNYVITASAEITITGIKILKNKDLAADMFEFALYKADENQNITDTTPVEVVKNKASGEFTFSKLIFDGKDGHRGAGTYYYIIKEISGALAGITYDTQQYFVKITVTDTDSILTATSTGADNIVFTNTYNTEPVKVIIGANKALTGKTLADGEFSFVIAEVGGSYTETVKNAADGSISFSELTFDKIGTYIYTVSEVIGFAGGIKYDETKYTVTITVTDNGEGKLIADVKGADGILFKNSYNTENTEVRFSGTKQLLGRPIVAGEFEFILEGSGVSQTVKAKADGSFAFDAISYDKAGTYKYTVKEIKGSLAGVTYDEKVYEITVEVTDDGNGKLVTKVTGADSITFTNKYKATAAEIIFSGNKQLTGRPLKAGEFSFTLVGADDGVNETVQNDANGNFVFHTVKYETAGTYNYTISEVKGNLGGITYDFKVYNIKVVVTDEGGKLVAKIQDPTPVVFKNTYSTEKTTVQIGGNKVLTGRDLNAGEFSFTITGNGINETVSNDASGSFTFSAIEYTAAGTYTYTVSEVKGALPGIKYDETVYTVTVNVTDDGNGKLVAEVSGANSIVFNNSYNAESTEVVFSGTKKLTGRDIIAGEFEFILKGEGVEQTVKADANGNFSFDTITYTKVGTYEYTVEEIDGKLPGVTYDNSTINITVKVTDEGNGKLVAKVTGADSIVFNNSYDAEGTEIYISGTKKLIGRDLNAGEFEFILEGEGVSQTTKVKADGSFTFNAIPYDEVGTHKYTVKEVKGNLPGVAYDETVHEITVEVTDDGKGNLVAEVTSAKAIVFENTYSASAYGSEIVGIKILAGRDLRANEFQFVLKDSNGKIIQTVSNDADGKFTFSKINYSSAGVYEYTISEVNNKIKGITYDTSVYNITVVATDNGDGTLSTTISGADNLIFTNSYRASNISITLSGTKALIGRDLKDKEFTFLLKNINGVVIDTATNNANGEFSFDAIKFNSRGTFTFYVCEQIGSEIGMNYDTTEYRVIITITDSGSGYLSAEVRGAHSITFTNVFATPTYATFTGTKILEGKDLAEGAYSFELKDSAGNVIETVKNAADGTIRFSAIEYTKAGTYNYTVSEVPGNDASVLYDATVYPITVTVTDNGRGKLVANVQSDNIVFTNRALTPATVTFDGHKYLDLVLAGGFNFVMKEGDNVIANATSNENGYFNFGTLVYDREGTYTYTISEVIGNDENIIYDTNVFTVTVTVTLEGTEFKANTKVDLPNAATGIAFYNHTIPEETTEVPEETTTVPEETTTVPEETTTVPEETTTIPEETTVTPEETTVVPEETTAPEETTKVPEETTDDPEDTETPNPPTGGESRVIIWFGAAIIAFCATAGALFSKKRSTDNE